MQGRPARAAKSGADRAEQDRKGDARDRQRHERFQQGEARAAAVFDPPFRTDAYRGSCMCRRRNAA
ncbi:hypothetical protein AA103193_2883 [Tanticharoenia sakaeratensis NBRC 103193]|nr:hypothetical protein AA103193_2883 [Tanticharoenia sakaeratensis NBRC 103193]